MSLAGGLRELLRPPPHRGPLIAAGGVAFAIGVALTCLRIVDDASEAVLAGLPLATGALLFWLGAQAPNEDGEPPAYQSVLLATGWPMLVAGLSVLVQAIGLPADLGLALVAAVSGALALWPALERNSAISLLGAAIAGAVALQATWVWVFDTTSMAPIRWLMLLYAIGLVLGSLALREPARRHAEVLIDAAGAAIAWIALGEMTNVFEPTGTSLPAFWEVVLLGAGLGLAAFGALDRSPGPAYLGVVNIVLFILAAADGDSLLVWPAFLLVGGAIMLIAGLRPRRPLPPEPDPYRSGEAPLAARADDREIVVRVRND